MWKPHSKYLYGSLNKKESELTKEEKKLMLLHPPLAIPERVKRYLDTEMMVWNLQETYYSKTKQLQQMQTQKDESRMQDVKSNEKESNIKKRKRTFSITEPATKRRPMINVIEAEQVENLVEELEKERRVPGEVVEQALKEIEKLTRGETIERLRRTHLTAVTTPAPAGQQQQPQERKETKSVQEPKTQPTGTEEEMKQEKKLLREKIVAGQVELEKLDGDVKKWLMSVPQHEMELEDGKLYIQTIQMKAKVTKSTVMEGFSEALVQKGNLKEGHVVMNWVRLGLDQINKK
jgi:beta-galactosidase beta subunit